MPATLVANLPPATELTWHLDLLEEQGYAILPGFLDPDATARLRGHLRSLVPPPAPAAVATASTAIHTLRHPIPGAIMAEAITAEHIELCRRLFGATDPRLCEQVLIRTDRSAHPPGAHGWHLDYAFCPRHRAARPRQTYVHMVHALSTVASGGGATMLVPGSHRATYAAAAQLTAAGEGDSFRDQETFKAEVLRLAGIDTRQAIEVLPREGDLVLFDPMCLHSASYNTNPDPRHVLFMSFFDASATELNDSLNRQRYRDSFPESLRDGLRPEWRSLLDR